MSILHLTIQTPETTVVDIMNVVSINAEMTDGQFGILPGHIPMTAGLAIALLTYQTEDGKTETVSVMGGVLQTDGKKVTVLTEAAELAASIDEHRAKQALERAEERLQRRTAEVDVKRAERAMARAFTRMKATK